MGEPPLLLDPGRWGSLVGLAGGTVFIASYSSALGAAASTIAWVAGLAGVAAALFRHYVRPVALGPLVRPGPRALATYAGCVAGELVLIALGSRALAAVHHGELRPALIAAVVGAHFIPFAWAFRERVFSHLGGAVTAIGAAGLVAGALGVPRAAEGAAVAAGLVMIAVLVLHAQGRFAAPRTSAWREAGPGRR
ncbi:DUF7010 family protein [Kineococcus sp. SYSU DK005]|uniref:DUF7010 family protein n=1 Tax=Kineococcus sp. SYSU DK005 TaxID=3383126 RepID=UPI003D7F0830